MTRRHELAASLHPESASGNAEGDPAHALYGHAAALLASAGALQAAAHTPGAAGALGPTLACLEASFEALVGLIEQLGSQAVRPPSHEGVVRTEERLHASEVEHRFHDLIDALEASHVACAYARAAVGPVQSCARRGVTRDWPPTGGLLDR